MPLVSCFIPAFKGMPHLQEAVESIRQQAFGDWECIVIDDASTDGTWSYLQSLDDPRFVVHRMPANSHVAATSNLAQQLARGQYLARLDQDDRAVPERLALQVAYMQAHPDVTVCGGWMQLFGEHQGLAHAPQDDAHIKANFLMAMGNIANPASMVRLDFLRQHRLYSDPQFPLSCDYGLWVECMLRGARFANLPQVLTHYRIHGQQGSRHLAEVRRGVQRIRTLILHHWYPALTAREIDAIEPLLHAQGVQSMTREQLLQGLSVCDRLQAEPGTSQHGEDRQAVAAYIAKRAQLWRDAMNKPQSV